MGRKKRKIVDEAVDDAPLSGLAVTAAVETASSLGGTEGDSPLADTAPTNAPGAGTTSDSQSNEQGGTSGVNLQETQKLAAPSGYVMTSHSGEIIQEDIYVSDGSSDDDGNEADEVQILLVGSRMGLMRRGLHHPSLLLQQPNRQWTRSSAESKPSETDPNNITEEGLDAAAAAAREEQRRLDEEAELAKLDPAQRAARLLQEKQRKLEEAKEAARRMESELNAGRDPMLFSKRTAFDIRFDQIDDKPWLRGHGDFSDFFNYGLSEEDWLEYAATQLPIRQELIDASRQKRQPDPTIVPVLPRAPNSQDLHKNASKVDKTIERGTADELSGADETQDVSTSIGPVLVKTEEINPVVDGPDKQDTPDAQVVVGAGGAWGAGAPPGSLLARLIEEQGLSNAQPQVPVAAQRQEQFTPTGGDEENNSSWQQGHSNWQQENMHNNNNNSDDAAPSDTYEETSMDMPSGTSIRDHSGSRHRPDEYHGQGGGAARDYPSYPPPPQQAFRGRGRGRGSYGGRFGGRGDTGPGRLPAPPPPWEGRSGASNSHYYSKKRPREGGDPRWQR